MENFEQNNLERSKEVYPSVEEVKSVFEKLTSGALFTEIKLESDEHGLLKYWIEVEKENGEKVEYNYQRAEYDHTNPSLPSSAKYSASIHSVLYTSDGIPYGGDCVANYLEGKWEYPSS